MVRVLKPREMNSPQISAAHSPVTSKPFQTPRYASRPLPPLQKTPEGPSQTNETFIVLFSHYVQWARRDKAKTDTGGGTHRGTATDGTTRRRHQVPQNEPKIEQKTQNTHRTNQPQHTRHPTTRNTRRTNQPTTAHETPQPQTHRDSMSQITNSPGGFSPSHHFIYNTERFQTRSSLTIK